MAATGSKRRFTIMDISGWDGRWELIDGVPYNMTPAPSTAHQLIVGELLFALRSHLGNSGCSIFVAPFDVQLDNNDKYTVVQPDISVFCNKQNLYPNGAIGAADLIVEVLSPSTALKDRREKFTLYERSDVKEYWIVDHLNHTIEVYGLSEERYSRRQVFGMDDTLHSNIFPELLIEMKNILQGQ
ncbi:Uma2 family endonuclease [Sporosarcina highlanderae]|uniref:Uma2 family endonuclease n=1 Tax=Sporosarcina highlanderae TaxID=3035916 RepID=A0ABT8JN94_9BACL|nr:Uma2 family endonuclease [Sporosarcina highlanderae]MDN4606620.1 Uma2 family endonuclease [Sporosarcina highlanderae]